MAKVTVVLIADPTQAQEAMASVKAAMETVQTTGAKVSAATTDMIPTKPLDDASSKFLTTNRNAMILANSFGIGGMQARVLMLGLRAATVSGGTLTGTITGMSTAVKGFVTSIGPVGWAIMAVVAAIGAVNWAWNRHKKALEENKKAIEEYNASQKELRNIARSTSIEILELEGKKQDALRATINLDIDQRKQKLQEKMLADQEAATANTTLSKEEMGEARTRGMRRMGGSDMSQLTRPFFWQKSVDEEVMLEEKKQEARKKVFERYLPQFQQLGRLQELKVSGAGDQKTGFSGVADMWKKMQAGITPSVENKTLAVQEKNLTESQKQAILLQQILVGRTNTWLGTNMPILTLEP